MKKQLIVLSIAAMTSGAAFAVAGGAPVANQFSAGQPARAADVNANFQELADRIDSNNADIIDNVADIATNATDIAAINSDLPTLVSLLVNENLLTRTFEDQTPPIAGECDVRIDSFTFNTTAKTFEQNFKYKDSVGDAICNQYVYSWDYSSDLVSTGSTTVIYNRSAAGYTYGWNPGILLMKEKMREGETWASFSDNPNYGLRRYDKLTFLGYQSVTVPYGSFQGCVVMEQQVVIYNAGINDTYIQYFCDGPGLTRSINLTARKDFQLTGYTTQ